MNQLLRGYWISGSSSARQQNGIVVEVLLLVEQHAVGLHPPDDVAVGLLDPAALIIRRLGGELAVGADGVDQLRPLSVDEPLLFGQQDFVVHLAEGRGLVDDAGAGIDRRRTPPPRPARRHAARPPAFRVPCCALVLPIIVEGGPIAAADQLLAPHDRLDGKLLADLRRRSTRQRGGHDKFPCLSGDRNHDVVQVELDRRELVARQRPGRRGPNQQIGITFASTSVKRTYTLGSATWR